MKGLHLQYYNLKDIMTSAQMPGSTAQGDKALGFFTGLMTGYKAFNLMPLSTDQVWSPEQALLDVQASSDAAEAIRHIEGDESVYKAAGTISEVLEKNCLFAETVDTLMNMQHNYQFDFLHKRFQTSEAWKNAGQPEELFAIEQKKEELIAQWDYHPPQDKLEKVIDIYYKLCSQFHTEPLKFD